MRLMKANKVFETINFERGQDPKEAMRIGKYRHSKLRRILVKDGVSVEPEWESEWIDENPLLKEKLELKETDVIYSIELDSYCEERNIDREELEMEFTAKYSFPPVKPGEVRVKIGVIPDGSKVIYYSGGNVDGFITKKDWLR